MKPACREMTKPEIEDFLTSEVTGRLAMAVDNSPYVVPLAYVYMDGEIYIHWFGQAGKKADMLDCNSKVCFEVDTYSRDHLDRQSVIIEGKAAKVTDRKTIKRFLLELAKKYPEFVPGKLGNHPEAVKVLLSMGMPFMEKAITVHVIVPESITSKKWSREFR